MKNAPHNEVANHGSDEQIGHQLLCFYMGSGEGQFRNARIKLGLEVAAEGEYGPSDKRKLEPLDSTRSVASMSFNRL